MLFNSYVFIFVFLPTVICLFYGARRLFGQQAALFVLLAASLFFYGWWDLRNLWLLTGSISFNYLAGRLIRRTRRKAILVAAIVINLLLLGYFKYANFFVDNVNAVSGENLTLLRVILPLGISFFTFEQVTFLVDIHRNRTEPGRPLNYGLFVAFFPHLIAGPIVQHRSLAAQFSDAGRQADPWRNLGLGLAIFTVGLVKKVVLADSFQPVASDAFNAAAHGFHLPLGAAWAGVLAYTFQIFFDFSGYSDMALGLARMFGFSLPVNFRSPYRSLSITDFWRRWHISLSTFLREYVYIPLGGNRRGEARQRFNLMATMLLGGLWHGAAWTFVVWGGLHGAYLVIAQLWGRHVALPDNRAFRAAAWLITFLAVAVAWVFFRASSFEAAGDILASMAGLHGKDFGVEPDTVILVLMGFAAVFALPDTVDLFRLGDDGEPLAAEGPERTVWWMWRPSTGWAVSVGIMLFVSLLSISRESEFIYYQF